MKTYHRSLFIFFLVVLAGLVGYVALRVYHEEHSVAGVDRSYASDTIGGTTPQETIKQYRTAIAENNDAQAVEFFVKAHREAEAIRLREMNAETRQAYITLLESVERAYGTYSDDKNAFTVREPLFINIIKYPNGIWKIVER